MHLLLNINTLGVFLVFIFLRGVVNWTIKQQQPKKLDVDCWWITRGKKKLCDIKTTDTNMQFRLISGPAQLPVPLQPCLSPFC